MNDETIWGGIYRFLRREMTLAQFEQWVYITPEIEAILGDVFYLDLISANYTHPKALHTISMMVMEQVDEDAMRRWFVGRALQEFIADTGDRVAHIADFYHAYCDGDRFLSPLALVYVTANICDVDLEIDVVHHAPRTRAEAEAEIDRLYPEMVKTAEQIYVALQQQDQITLDRYANQP